jgi:hypothetical protein
VYDIAALGKENFAALQPQECIRLSNKEKNHPGRASRRGALSNLQANLRECPDFMAGHSSRPDCRRCSGRITNAGPRAWLPGPSKIFAALQTGGVERGKILVNGRDCGVLRAR